MDWVVLLPVSLFQAWNVPYYFHFIPFETLYGATSPVILTGPVVDVPPLNNRNLFFLRLIALRTVQENLWPQFSALYATETPVPHKVQPEDVVYSRDIEQEH